MERLLASIHEPPKDMDWPPPFEVIHDPAIFKIVGDYNAYAEIVGKDEQTGKWKPHVAVTPKFMIEIVEGKAAIYLVGPNAPFVPIKTTELGSNFFNVQVGMTRADLDAGLAALAGYEISEVIEPQEYFRYYPGMGFGVRLDKGRVAEIILAVVPRGPGQ